MKTLVLFFLLIFSAANAQYSFLKIDTVDTKKIFTKNFLFSGSQSSSKDTSSSWWEITPVTKKIFGKTVNHLGETILQLDTNGNYTFGFTHNPGGSYHPSTLRFQQTIGDTNSLLVRLGQQGIHEFNLSLNFNYDTSGNHKKDKQTVASMSFTGNLSGLYWQCIPSHTRNNVDPAQDVWIQAQYRTPWQVDSSGNQQIYGGFLQRFQRTADNTTYYVDTSLYSSRFIGGKNFFQNKVGIGTLMPAAKFHLVGDGGPMNGAYNANADAIYEDNGTRTLIQLLNPNSSYISFGDASTYNSGYIGYTMSSGTMDITAATGINLNNNISTLSITPLSDNNRNLGSSLNRWANIYLGNALIWTYQTPPVNASATGVQGTTFIGTDGYLYSCTSTNTWKRAQLITW